MLAIAGLTGCGPDDLDEPDPLPPAQPPEEILLEMSHTAGSAEVGTFHALPGNLWISGRCAGGELTLHVEPVAVLPIPCGADEQPFRNQIVMREPTDIRLRVVAADSVTWSVAAEQ